MNSFHLTGCYVLIGLLSASSGCATQYAYRFELTGPGVHLASSPAQRDTVEDNEHKAEIQMTEDAILLDLTNKTQDVLQVEWGKIVVDRGDGTKNALRPDVDLGWIAAGARASARLVPFSLPRSGEAAAAYQGRQLELDVPVVVRHEPTVYRFPFVAHVRPQ